MFDVSFDSVPRVCAWVGWGCFAAGSYYFTLGGLLVWLSGGGIIPEPLGSKSFLSVLTVLTQCVSADKDPSSLHRDSGVRFQPMSEGRITAPVMLKC